jgi:hypothetical protein
MRFSDNSEGLWQVHAAQEKTMSCRDRSWECLGVLPGSKEKVFSYLTCMRQSEGACTEARSTSLRFVIDQNG